jgi:hypothetical protein
MERNSIYSLVQASFEMSFSLVSGVISPYKRLLCKTETLLSKIESCSVRPKRLLSKTEMSAL